MNKLQTARANKINEKMQVRFPNHTFSYGDVITLDMYNQKRVAFQAVSPEGFVTVAHLHIHGAYCDIISHFDTMIFLEDSRSRRGLPAIKKVSE